MVFFDAQVALVIPVVANRHALEPSVRAFNVSFATKDLFIMIAETDNVRVRSRWASALLALHRFDEAEQMLRALVDQGDADPALLHNLGLAVYQQRRWIEAADLFAKADAAGLQSPVPIHTPSSTSDFDVPSQPFYVRVHRNGLCKWLRTATRSSERAKNTLLPHAHCMPLSLQMS